MQIRRAVKADLPNLLPLMFGRAKFEKYADGFAITEEVLHEQGFAVPRPISIVSWLKKAAR